MLDNYLQQRTSADGIFKGIFSWRFLWVEAPITTKVVCLYCLLKYIRSFYEKQCGPRSDCSHRSSLIWVQTVCFLLYLLVCNVSQLFEADAISRRHFKMPLFVSTIGAVWSGPTLLASYFNQSVMLNNYLQQRPSADGIFRCLFI